MAKIISFPRKTDPTDIDKTILWVIKVVEHMVATGQAKECNLHLTKQGAKDIDGFIPTDVDQIVNAIEYLKREGAIVL